MTMTTYTEQELPGISLTTSDTEFPITAININGAVDGDGVTWTVEATLRTHLMSLPKQCLLSHCLLMVT